MTGSILGDRRDTFGWAELIARLKPGFNLQQAQARLNGIGKQIQRVTGLVMSDRDDFLLRDGSQGIGSMKEQFGKPVLLLLMLVVIVLLVACANLAALLPVRSVERTREAGMRVALGASRPALFRLVSCGEFPAGRLRRHGWLAACPFSSASASRLARTTKRRARRPGASGRNYICILSRGYPRGRCSFRYPSGVAGGACRSDAGYPRQRVRFRRALASLSLYRRRTGCLIAGFIILRRIVCSDA